MKLELLLVIGTFVFSLLWFIGKRLNHQAYVPWHVGFSRSFAQVLFVVLVLRTFIAEPFRIPSGSMLPTLLVGDFILVNKFSYGLRLPVVHNKVLNTGSPERGDVIVFRYPPEPSKYYIKRLIGLPGDLIEYKNRSLFINGERIQQKLLGPYQQNDLGTEILEESLKGHTHKILLNMGIDNNAGDGKLKIPENNYFVLGDNRDNSNDSRFWLRSYNDDDWSWGLVPEQNLVGKAGLIWMNWKFEENKADFNRIGTKIQ